MTRTSRLCALAVLGGGRFATASLTEHARTNLQTLALFGVTAGVEGDSVVVVEPV